MYGILVVDKPIGPTSRDCVNQATAVLRQANDHATKIAHAGTLDPLASGAIVLLLGPAVRLMDQVHAFDKEYIGSFQVGCSSPSADLETEVVSLPNPNRFSKEDLQATLNQFLGPIEQIPPAYSAIRVNGKRAHKQARKGLEVQMPKRTVIIHELELVEWTPESFTVRTVCSTGTYMRTLGSDIAKALGSDAVMSSLRRTRVGPFSLDHAIPLAHLPNTPWGPCVLSPALAVSHLPKLFVNDLILRKILDGKRLPWQNLIEHQTTPLNTFRPQLQPNSYQPISTNPTANPPVNSPVAILDDQWVLRAILTEIAPDQWRCEKGIAHWDVLPKAPEL
jgi:tRNA pseudouridine55 synthase